MAPFTVFRIEWRRIWRNKLTRAAMIVGLILPLLYSFLYLWAFWNPYQSLSKLPVAIVNADTGGMSNGKNVNYGHQLAKNLETDKQLGWHVVTSSQASAGVAKGTYYAVLKIPANFTKAVLSVSGKHPQKAQLQLTPNQGSNYLAGKIIGDVQTDVAASLNKQFSGQFLKKLLDVVGQESSGLSSAASSAKSLAAGSKSLRSGTKQLNSGIVSADSGAAQLTAAMVKLEPGGKSLASGLAQTASGTKSAASGVKQAGNGVSQIQQKLSPASSAATDLTSGLGQAVTATQQLQGASSQIANGTKKAVAGAGTVSSGLTSAVDASKQIQKGLGSAVQILNRSPTSQDPNVQKALSVLDGLVPASQQLSGSLDQLQQGASSLQSSLSQIQTNQSQVTTGLSKLSTQLGSAKSGSSQLAQGLGQAASALTSVQSGLTKAGAALDKLASAQSKMQTGAQQLTAGLSQASGGAKSLQAGLDSAKHGSASVLAGASNLANGASTFSNKLAGVTPASIGNTAEKAKLMADPVTIRSVPVNPVSKYGPGLTPYFLPLSLWVGALMLYFIMSMKEGRWRIAPVSSTSVLLGKFGVLWSIGVLQAVIAASALMLGLGLTVTSTIGFYLFAILMAITYVTVIGTLLMLLGTGPGRFITIVLLLLQLTSSGGTFPVQLVPRFFQALHPWLPMSYAVTGLRRLIAYHDLSVAWSTAGVTALYLGGALVVAILLNLKRVTAAELRVPDRLVS